MKFLTDDLVNFAKTDLNQFSNEMLIDIADSARNNHYYGCGHNLGVMITNLPRKCDYVRRSRIYHAAGESTGLPIYKSAYIEAGTKAVVAAGFSV